MCLPDWRLSCLCDRASPHQRFSALYAPSPTTPSLAVPLRGMTPMPGTGGGLPRAQACPPKLLSLSPVLMIFNNCSGFGVCFPQSSGAETANTPPPPIVLARRGIEPGPGLCFRESPPQSGSWSGRTVPGSPCPTLPQGVPVPDRRPAARVSPTAGRPVLPGLPAQTPAALQMAGVAAAFAHAWFADRCKSVSVFLIRRGGQIKPLGHTWGGGVWGLVMWWAPGIGWVGC